MSMFHLLARTETQSTVSHGRTRLDWAGTKGCGSGRKADPGICKRTRSSPSRCRAGYLGRWRGRCGQTVIVIG
ncbi:hypothetical protein BDZ85DRAFT_129066 [Elsinoe ampelina]|uniref:Uncharacterized protein n=1 Tax=Elsinoe ampelina TaxID=302913 RepID=A0A6A6G9Z0_9PEZI|nr:hypothetical protein BDZ85DRAFT_129066 [Elsinoe ampelina]